jgi:hypothetical protein
MARGDHIRVSRQGYWHHGIDCGDGTVIHYVGPDREKKRCAAVRRTTLQEFCRGCSFRVVPYRGCDGLELVMSRAEARLGDAGYDLFGNNCEHFAYWCKTGQKRSRQVRRAARAAAGVGALAVTTLLTAALRLRRGGAF